MISALYNRIDQPLNPLDAHVFASEKEIAFFVCTYNDGSTTI